MVRSFDRTAVAATLGSDARRMACIRVPSERGALNKAILARRGGHEDEHIR
jgi:hypothetical protein